LSVRRRLLWSVYPYYVIIIVASLVAIGYYGSREMRNLYLEKVTTELEARARLVRHQFADAIRTGGDAEMDGKCKTLGRLSGTRITVVDRTGKVLADSDEDPAVMDNHGQRPEIVTAFAGQEGEATRYSRTLHRMLKYVAIPVERDGEVVAAVRTAIPVTTIQQELTSLSTSIVIAGIIILLAATVISLVVFGRLRKPLVALTENANRLAAGDFSVHLPVHKSEEIGALTAAMNNMARQLDARIRTIVEQRNEQEAILSSMSEGVVALDDSLKVLSMNAAAARFFDADEERARGKRIQEVIRNADLHDLAQAALQKPDPVEREILLRGDRDRYLQVRGTALRDAGEQQIGAVLVVNDITRIKRLEQVRRDFVANVSHELRTPITAITGSIETLLDGQVDKPDDSRRFLEIVGRHAARLNAIVEDLLTLSRLENEAERGGLKLEPGSVCAVVEAAVAACQHTGAERKVKLTVECEEGLTARMDAAKLEQALVNLIDNAIKASPADSEVAVRAQRSDREVVIAVQDHGDGIEPRHLPRLFERFYRVDDARSRERGGTGLGLAIVKHTMLGHGGRVTVESRWRKGSTFQLRLPAVL